MKTVDERELQKQKNKIKANKDRKEQGNRSYCERVRAK